MPAELSAFYRNILQDPQSSDHWLVLADALQAQGDDAGELITLRQQVVASGASEEQSHRMQELSRDHAGLARLFDSPTLPLPFVGGGRNPARYDVTSGGVDYYFELRTDRFLRVAQGEGVDVYEWQDLDVPGLWTAPEINTVLHLFAESIREGYVQHLTIPHRGELPTYEHYYPGLLPLSYKPDCLQRHEHDWRCLGQTVLTAYEMSAWEWAFRRWGELGDD
jgi:uncharacterized protein (TIGR02996 family)